MKNKELKNKEAEELKAFKAVREEIIHGLKKAKKEDLIITPFLKRMNEQYKKIEKAFKEKKGSRLKNLIDETGKIFIQHHEELSNKNHTWQYGEWLTKLDIAFKDMENDIYKEYQYWD